MKSIRSEEDLKKAKQCALLLYGDQNEVLMNFMCIQLYTEKVANGYLAAYKGNYDFTAYYIENPT